MLTRALPSLAAHSHDTQRLLQFILDAHKRSKNGVTVVTGAGISTNSGIPDYRGLTRRQIVYKPMRHDEFMRSDLTRRRYWARSFNGWAKMTSALPNDGHFGLSELQRMGLVTHIVTQNVDRLHHKAGSSNVCELHGTIFRVKCTSCLQVEDRFQYQTRLAAANAADGSSVMDTKAQQLPDGDTDVQSDTSTFVVPPCLSCGGVLKPDVTFYGGNISEKIKEHARQAVESSGGILLVGTTSHVYSCYSLALAARELGLPIGIVNLGDSRADPLAELNVQQSIPDVMRAVVQGARDAVGPGRAA